MPPRPPSLLLATAALGAEAAMLLVAAVISAVDTAAGRSYQRSSGIALTIIAFGAVIVVVLIAVGVYRVRRWSRTPALLTQLFVGTTGVYLLEGHRLDWGVPALLVALAGFAGLLVPPSWRALATGPMSPKAPETTPPSASPEGKASRAACEAPQAAQPAGKTAGSPAQAAAPGARTVPPTGKAARPSGKKASSRRR
jgi:hypothetical protein